MDTETLAKSVKLAESVSHLLVTTVNEHGIPHLATAERITLDDRDRVAVTAWFCPQVERKLVIRVRHILNFSHVPHSDTEIL